MVGGSLRGSVARTRSTFVPANSEEYHAVPMWLCLWCVWFQFAFSFSLNFLFPFLSRALRGVDRACRSIPLRRRGEALPGLGHRRGALLIFKADAPVGREERSVTSKELPFFLFFFFLY